MYRILFRPAGLDAAYARRLVTDFLGTDFLVTDGEAGPGSR